MDEKPEGGPKSLKKSSGAPRIVSPGTDPLLQPEVNLAPKPKKSTKSGGKSKLVSPTPKPVEPTPKPISQPATRSVSVPKPMNTAPAKERVIAPSITSFTPARAHLTQATKTPAKPGRIVDSFVNKNTPRPNTNAVADTPESPTLGIGDDAEKIIQDLAKDTVEEVGIIETLETTKTPETTKTSETPETTSNPASVSIANAMANEEKPAKKKMSKKAKKIIIFSIIGCIIIALGAVATVLAIQLLNKDDKVTEATIKLLSGNRPKYAQLTGTVEVAEDSGVNTSSSKYVSSINDKVDFETGAVQSNSKISMDVSGTKFSLDYDWIRDGAGNYYISSNSMKNMTIELNEASQETSDSIVYIQAETNDGPTREQLSTAIDQVLGNKWVTIAANDTDHSGDLKTSFGGSQLTQCWSEAFLNLPNLGNGTKTLYEKNPFISYATNDLKISAKNNNLYRLIFDADKLTYFINAMPNNNTIKNLFNCMGVAVSGSVTVPDVVKIAPANLDVYVEIDGDNNFTRLYFEYKDGQGVTMKADLDITYPSELSITIPTETIGVSEFISQLASALKPAEPEPEEPTEDSGWYDPDNDYNDTYIESEIEEESPAEYDDPAQSIDPDSSGSSYDPNA